MKTQKTSTLLRGLALAGCFLIVQQTVAQELLGSGSAYYNVLGIGTDGTIRITPTTGNGESSIGFYTNPNHSGPYWVAGNKGWGNMNDFTIGIGGTGNPGVKFLIQPDGKVGIGTSNPERSLHVRGDVIRVDRDAENPSIQITRYVSGYTDIWKVFQLSTEGYGVNNGKFIISDRGTTTGGEGATPRFTIANNGYIGIGTVNPEEKLHIMGNLRVDDGEYQSLGPVVLHPDTDNSGDDSIQFLNSTEEEIMRIHTDGNVGIGTANPTEKLEVNGTVKATSFTSSAASFPDYVFAADYKITPLTELEIYVRRHQRLPNIPSEQEVVKHGLNMSEVLIKSVENIETIYLHLIRMEKEIKALKQENATLKQQMKQGR